MTGNSFQLGATVVDGGVSFAVWSTKATAIEVVIDGDASWPMAALEDNHFQVTVSGIGAGTRYQYRMDGGPLRPDPRSRFQPEGVHGPSEVVDTDQFAWTDEAWAGLHIDGLVIYELHVGTFTPEGTFRGVIEQLPALAELGIDAIELMPIGAFPGQRNWGYDGVDHFAPSEQYGRPEDLQTLVDAAHHLGIGVILDVVYNHFGPAGNYLRDYSDEYFTTAHLTPWGEAVNYDGPGNADVRSFVIDNAVQWIRDFHFDGFRFDATEQIVDLSPRYILAEVGEAARAATSRSIVLIAEEASNLVDVVHPVAAGGWGFDSFWADDFHHSLLVFLTSLRDHYYVDYSGTLIELAKAINEGIIYQGEHSEFRGKPRGSKVTDEPASAFTICLQNHDQVGNQPFGERLNHLIDRERYAVATTLLLTMPNPVVLFMGQEFTASTPFLFFTDHHGELAPLVTKGRREEFAGMQEFGDVELVDTIPDPQADETFNVSKLRPDERPQNGAIGRLHADLLRLRKADPVFSVADRSRTRAEVAGAKVMIMRRWTDEAERIVIANFGAETTLHIDVAPANTDQVSVLFNSAESIYGGAGRLPYLSEAGTGLRIRVPARTAIVLAVSTATANKNGSDRALPNP